MIWPPTRLAPSMPMTCRAGSRILMVLALSGMMAACDEAQTELHKLAGTWQSRGYGLIAEIDADQVRIIERTPSACVPSDSYAAGRFLHRLRSKADADASTFALGRDGTLSTITFDRLGEGGLDSVCPHGLAEGTSDPTLNFDVLWQTFDEHYAFFSERHVDWDAVHADMRPRISDPAADSDLAPMLEQLFEDLGDAHVTLHVDGDDIIYIATRLENRLREECQATGCDLYDEWELRQEVNDDIVIANYLGDDVETGLEGDAMWGRIGAETGYFRIDSMSDLSGDGHGARDDIEALDDVLDKVLEDLGDLPSMIIDVRNNGGGHDAVAVAIASRFTGERVVFGSKQAYIDGDNTAPQDLVVEPAEGERYHGRVTVLISGQTASAAEIFTMAMRALPQVTLIGEPTVGILSDELYRSLPNGWQFSLSNEIYLTYDGELFEESGVPPEIAALFLDKEALDEGEDSGIEAALRVLGGAS